MRIALSHRLSILAAVSIAVATIGASHLPVTTTTAAAAPVLTQNDFHDVTAQGFGDPANSWAWSMAWYNSRLYVGTNRYFDCAERYMFHELVPWLFPYPVPDPALVCPSVSPGVTPTVQALVPTLGAEIWSIDPSTTPLTTSNWSMVYQSPLTVPITLNNTSLMGPRDMGFRDTSIYDDGDPNGPALYVSGVGIASVAGTTNTVPPPSLLRTTDGTHFAPVPADPGTTLGDLGASQSSMRGQVSYNGEFYLIIGDIYGAGSVYVSPTPNLGGSSFQQVTPADMKVFEMATFNGHLYLGVQSHKGGYLVEELNDAACTTLPCPDSAFQQVVPAGGGLRKPNWGIVSMHVYTDTAGTPHLYVGTDGSSNFTPAELIRINTDNSWDLIVGNPRWVTGKGWVRPLSGFRSGFNWKYNLHMWRMETYNGALYVGTYDDSTFEADSNKLPQGDQPYEGFDLYGSADGIHFSPVTLNGFGDRLSFGARTIQATPYGLFVGSTTLSGGFHVWEAPQTASTTTAPKG